MRTDEIDFRGAWPLLDVAAAAGMLVQLEPSRPLDAEIVPGVSAEWYLVQTYPGDDVRAMRWLARRRFGVFRPMQRREDGASGRSIGGFEPVFPGWLFVFCWMDKTSFRRILNCPGVFGLLKHPDSERPAVIDEVFVQRLRALGWVSDAGSGHAKTHAGVAGEREIKRQEKKVRSLGKAERKELHKLSAEGKRLGIWDASTWANANRLDPGVRIRLLRRALDGLAVSSGSRSQRA